MFSSIGAAAILPRFDCFFISYFRHACLISHYFRPIGRAPSAAPTRFFFFFFFFSAARRVPRALRAAMRAGARRMLYARRCAFEARGW
jgi:hypothetical protein